MMALNLDVLRVALVIASIIAEVQSVRCWHCIGEDCDADPTDNYKASKRLCNPGQMCQKVFYEMLHEEEGICKSTVRGCSTDCTPKNDFSNCSHDLRTTRGCVRKDCCSDADLCNTASTLTSLTLRHVTVGVMCLIVFFVCIHGNRYG